MSRIRIELPDRLPFRTSIPIRITDLNYGNHVGNDTILSLIHEARVQYIQHLGYQELNFAGVGLIMSDACIEFKTEVWYGEVLDFHIAASNISKVSFDVYYKIEKQHSGKPVTVAIAKTGMVCYDYTHKKITSIPAEAKSKMMQ